MAETTITDKLALNYHLMHPGEDSIPGDPNAAFYADGTYHLHYIVRRVMGDQHYSFVHVTSPDMLHWTWQPTKLQPSFTGHGMFSGTGFTTKEGRLAAIYHGQGSGRNHIVIAKNNQLSDWEDPYTIEPKTVDGRELDMHHWDPDCFLIDDTYYAISGGENPPLLRSNDLETWTYVGDFMNQDNRDVAIGEDVSCPNFFRIGERWMLLCISHPFGCRYYVGDWDEKAEQFVPEFHGRMNWRRPEQSLYDRMIRDFFAPESVLTPDGRRVMWAWLWTLDDEIARKTIQSLPRELSLGEDGGLRIKPLRELETLRRDSKVVKDVVITGERGQSVLDAPTIAELEGDAFEIRITIGRDEAARKRFGVRLFADESHEGLPVLILPEYGKLLVGSTEAPFSVADLPDGEDVDLRIFIDKYLVEVFANDRQAVVASFMDHESARSIRGYSFAGAVTLRKVEIWRVEPTNRGFLEARESRIWEVDRSG